jgi:arsenate reductase (thioredoxin)
MIVASRGGSGLTIDQQLALRTAAARLQREFQGVVDAVTVEDVLRTSHDWFVADSAITRFLRAERFARQRLRALALVRGRPGPAGRHVVLFLDKHNASRSVMALGFFRQLAEDQAEVWSGGAEPGTEINPTAIAAMRERDINISREFPKPCTDDIVQAADMVITMGCRDTCPMVPDTRSLDWPLQNPDGLSIDAVRPIRDEIERRVRDLADELGITTAA